MQKKKTTVETSNFTVPKATSLRPNGLPFDVKFIAILLLLLIAVALAYYFLIASIPQQVFTPGAEVNSTEFLNIFSISKEAFIVMDLRNAQNGIQSNNVMQCGIDFASSNGFGDKNVTPLSLDKSSCVTPNGVVDYATCASMMKNRLVVYVRSGNDDVRYYSNGLVVSVGQNYTLSTCGIKIKAG